MFRTWRLAVALLVSGCTGGSQDVTDVPPDPGGEVSAMPLVASPEPASNSEPDSQPDADARVDDDSAPVVQEDLDQLFASFLESRDVETFLAIRQRIIAADAYEPYSDEFITAEQLIDLYSLDEAREALEGSMPNLLLSPRAHRLLAEIDLEAGDVQAAEGQRMMAEACIDGILTTGDGSEQRPYLILRTSDEYDVLTHLGKRSEMQSLIVKDEKHLDLIACTDGSEVWFDVTDAFARLTESSGR